MKGKKRPPRKVNRGFIPPFNWGSKESQKRRKEYLADYNDRLQHAIRTAK